VEPHVTAAVGDERATTVPGVSVKNRCGRFSLVTSDLNVPLAGIAARTPVVDSTTLARQAARRIGSKLRRRSDEAKAEAGHHGRAHGRGGVHG
jgi:hypothetical protein